MNSILRSPGFGRWLKRLIILLLWLITAGFVIAAIVCAINRNPIYTIACIGAAVSFCPLESAPLWWQVIVGLICLVLLS